MDPIEQAFKMQHAKSCCAILMVRDFFLKSLKLGVFPVSDMNGAHRHLNFSVLFSWPLTQRSCSSCDA